MIDCKKVWENILMRIWLKRELSFISGVSDICFSFWQNSTKFPQKPKEKTIRQDSFLFYGQLGPSLTQNIIPRAFSGVIPEKGIKGKHWGSLLMAKHTPSHTQEKNDLWLYILLMCLLYNELCCYLDGSRILIFFISLWPCSMCDCFLGPHRQCCTLLKPRKCHDADGRSLSSSYITHSHSSH